MKFQVDSDSLVQYCIGQDKHNFKCKILNISLYFFWRGEEGGK